MRCGTSRRWMVEFASDGIAPARAAAFQAHLDQCARCAAEWADIAAVDALLAHASQPVPTSRHFAELAGRIDDRLRDAPVPQVGLPLARALTLSGAAATLLLGLGFFLKAGPDATAPPTPERTVASAPAELPSAPAPARQRGMSEPSQPKASAKPRDVEAPTPAADRTTRPGADGASPAQAPRSAGRATRQRRVSPAPAPRHTRIAARPTYSSSRPRPRLSRPAAPRPERPRPTPDAGMATEPIEVVVVAMTPPDISSDAPVAFAIRASTRSSMPMAEAAPADETREPSPEPFAATKARDDQPAPMAFVVEPAILETEVVSVTAVAVLDDAP